MGKKGKIGKQRKDKFYQLAKETGYRSRAAFKLIQLNRKFEFLQRSRVCLDLCAAPGGWMQVAKENMPVSSLIVGVDLFPIRPIAGCLSLVGDITSDQCRTAITRQLQTWKADVVLHDGAPNVGRNWLHDAFQQACLTLSALRLACHFLRPGGWFVSKVFRSRDYHALVWVLKQLFRKVHATKPSASRSESAEIFIVCQGYVAPHTIDPKFLDVKHVFGELDDDKGKKVLDVYHPERQKKAKAVGYEDGDYGQHKKVSVGELLAAPDAVAVLQRASEIVIDDEAVRQHVKTTREVVECCKDIRVLGRKDLRLLLAWCKTLSEERNAPAAPAEPAVVVEPKDEGEEEEDEEKAIDQQIEQLQAEAGREERRRRKRALKERRRLNERLNLKMVLRGDDEGPTLEEDGDAVFSLRQIRSAQQLSQVVGGDGQAPAMQDSDDEEENNRNSKPKYVVYDKETSRLDSSGLFYKDEESELEMESSSEGDEEAEASGALGLSDAEEEVEEDAGDEEEADQQTNPLLVDGDSRRPELKRAQRAEMWFERDAFRGLIDEADEDGDLDRLAAKVNRGKVVKEDEQKVDTKDDEEDEDEDEDEEEEEEDYNTEEHFVTTPQPLPKAKKEKRKLNEEGLALGALMANSKKAKRDLVDAAWNRYAFNDEDLPEWFVRDEMRHMRPEAPVPKELVEDYRRNLQELNVRPIKKVVEAKARKKKRALRRLEKAKKKVEAIVDSADVTDREKTRQIQKLYKKARAEPKKEVTYVVAKKQHMTGRRVRRPQGVKGRFKVVDPRMKKDSRGAAAKQQHSKGGRKGGNKKGGRNTSTASTRKKKKKTRTSR